MGYAVKAGWHIPISPRVIPSRANPHVYLRAGIGIAHELKFSADGTRLLLTADRANHTGDVYVWHLASDKMQQVTQSSHGGIPTSTFVQPELIRFPTFDKDEKGATRTIPAWLYLP